MIRTILASTALAASISVHAAPEWVALSDSMADASFIDRSSLSDTQRYVDVEVLRNFDEIITLGTDPVTGAEMYPHRSVTLDYRVDCDAGKIAMTSWKMFDGNFANGDVVWAATNYGKPAFIDAVDDETRSVLRTACATNTAAR